MSATLKDMMLRTVWQLKIGGEEMAPHIVGAKGVTPIGSDGMWELVLRRHPATEKSLGVVMRAVAQATDPNRIPMTLNYDEILGSVDLDENDYLMYVERHDD